MNDSMGPLGGCSNCSIKLEITMEHTLIFFFIDELETEKQYDCYGLNAYVPPQTHVLKP